MDTRRTPAGVRRVTSRDDAGTPRSVSRSNSQTSQDSLRPPRAMVIPGTRFDDAPPPLPPPRFNEELAHGIDVAWSWGNGSPFGAERRLAPIKPGSTLHGSYLETRHGSSRYRDEDDMDLGTDDEDQRRGSTVSTVRSPSETNIHLSSHVSQKIRRPVSPAPANQRLHGELPLAQENIHRSSQAYDQRLLSRIGKPNSPPRHHRSSSSESTSFPRKLSLQTKEPKVQFLSSNELQPGSFDPVSRWISSPVSAGVSPGSRPNWRDYNMDPRSPSIDSAATSLILDPELFVNPRTGFQLSTSASAFGMDDSSSYTSRSHRGSYDHGVFGETENDLAGDEGSAFRNLKLSDSQHLGSLSSKPGTKRRAQSPPSDPARDKSPSRAAVSADSFAKAHTAAAARSPVSRYQPKHGSVSSTASSARQNSYASSIAPSIAGSSMTSISSFERQSPLDAPGHHAYITSAPPVSSPATSVAPSRVLAMQSPSDAKGDLRKMSIQSAVNETRLPPPTRIGNYYICDCCPKKPKKFDSEEDLRSHQMEKQYSCQYCNNRFKNKNEAERHQNSLHLRRYSWSCAAIPTYQAAFHASSSPSSQGLVSANHDACGFCGEEFPNLPQPDWDKRIEHLVNTHKFGECNQAKKFYRADHFRQHLKHSHAGQSGKWTNMLENMCLREEMPADATGGSPSGSESSPGRGARSLPPPGGPMGGATIDEVQDET